MLLKMLVKQAAIKGSFILMLFFAFTMTSLAVSTGFGEYPIGTPASSLTVPGVSFGGTEFIVLNEGDPLFSGNFLLGVSESSQLVITFDEPQEFASFKFFQLIGPNDVEVRLNGQTVNNLSFRGTSLLRDLFGEEIEEACNELESLPPIPVTGLSSMNLSTMSLSTMGLSTMDEPVFPFSCDDLLVYGTATIEGKFDQLVVKSGFYLPVECECYLSIFAIDDLTTDAWALTDGPPDDRLNWGYGDASIGILYPGDDAIDLYLVGTGQYIANFITLDDIPDTPPAENTIIRQEGNVTVSILTTGEIQFNMGPDSEGKTYTFIIEDIYGTDKYGSYYDPNE